jgi:hypothetical protein
VRTLKIGALVALFLAAIVAANLTLTHWGPSAIIPNTFFLIGLDLVTRDRLADFWGTTRWRKMLLLIAAGGALSYWVNDNAAKIAIASTVSFALAEGGEAIGRPRSSRGRCVGRLGCGPSRRRCPRERNGPDPPVPSAPRPRADAERRGASRGARDVGAVDPTGSPTTVSLRTPSAVPAGLGFRRSSGG